MVEVAVVGAGPAGLTAAIALASAGVETVLVAPPHRADNRTTAVLAGSLAALDALSVWRRCAPHAARLAAMRIVDDLGGLLRAPEILFRAAEIGLEAFGYNIENRHLLDALRARAAELPALRLIETAVRALDLHEDRLALRLDDGQTLSTRLAVAADGRESLCRRAAGIAVDAWSYRQTALTGNFAHGRPHGCVSTEFHTRHGPFTLVPLPGQRSSLVWVTDPARAERLAAMDAADFAHAAELQSHSILGSMRLEGERCAFALSGQTARRFGRRRVALVGEAAHVLPPIGAQGFNLGVRDATTIAELVVEAHRRGVDPGSADLLARYDRARQPDVQSRSLAIDFVNRSLLSELTPAHSLHGFGLRLLDRIGPLRRAVMREGVSPGFDATAIAGRDRV